jgi:hypothetical protein
LCVLRAGLWLSADTTGGRGNKSRFQLRDDGQYAESSFAGPEAVLAYLARYTYRVAIANRRLVSLDERGVTFRYRGRMVEDGKIGKSLVFLPVPRNLWVAALYHRML